MNILSYHMPGDISPAYIRYCLARNIARWNLSRRESFLAGEWTNKNGKESATVLWAEVAEARSMLIRERDAKQVADREAGRDALNKLRTAA